MEATSLNQVRAEVPEELAAVVQKMMAKDLAQRYQTTGALAQALAAFIKQGAKGEVAPQSRSDLPAAASPQGSCCFSCWGCGPEACFGRARRKVRPAAITTTSSCFKATGARLRA